MMITTNISPPERPILTGGGGCRDAVCFRALSKLLWGIKYFPEMEYGYYLMHQLTGAHDFD